MTSGVAGDKILPNAEGSTWKVLVALQTTFLSCPLLKVLGQSTTPSQKLVGETSLRNASIGTPFMSLGIVCHYSAVKLNFGTIMD